MKKIITLIMILGGFFCVNAQISPAELSIQTLTEYQNKYAEKGDFDNAAKYQKAIALKKNISKAIEQKNYIEVSNLKKELNQLFSSEADNNTYAPEYINHVYLLENNKLKNLDKKTGEIKTSTSASPWHASTTSSYYVAGANSSIQIKPNSEFVLKVADGVNPQDEFVLAKFSPNKDGRYLPYYKSTAVWYSANSENVNNSNVDIHFERIEGNIYRITLQEDLKDGEYAFMHGNKFFCFGVHENTYVRPTEEFSITHKEHILSNGFFLDGIIGAGVSNIGSAGFSSAFRMGNKFYFGRGRTYRAGLGVTWFRFGSGLHGFVDADGDVYLAFSINFSHSLGFINAIKFNNKIGLEINAYLGYNSMFIANHHHPGLIFNHNIKFRYKAFAVGLDIVYHRGFGEHLRYSSAIGTDIPIADGVNYTTIGVTIGAKFGKKKKNK